MHRSLATLPRLLFMLLALSAAVFRPSVSASAQTPSSFVVSDSLVQVVASDGTVYVGRITAVAADQITMETVSGVRVELRRAQVRRIEPALGRVVNGEYWAEDPNISRLFVTPTGRALRRGEGYIGIYELLFPFLAYGVTDRFTLAGGIPLFGGFAEGLPPFYLAPKFEFFTTPTLRASAGALAVVFEGESAGLLYGVGSFGTPDRALTAGLAYGYVTDGGEDGGSGEISNTPAIMVGGESRIGRRVKLLTENYFIPGLDGALLSGGARFIGRAWAFDFGLLFLVGEDGGGYLPLISFNYNFGRDR